MDKYCQYNGEQDHETGERLDGALEEDKLIDDIAIGFDSVEVVPSDDVFD